jgi:hypothetical protein
MMVKNWKSVFCSVMRTLVYHLPGPGLGHFVKRSDGFHFEFSGV